MGTRIRIMDLEVDLLTEESLQREMTGYLENDHTNVVHLISLDYIDTYDKNELVQKVLERADMVLPGEKAILSAHHVDVLETGGMVVDYHSLLNLVKPLELAERTFYLILRNEKEAKAMYRYLTNHFPKENILGVYISDGNVSEETLVNDINIKLPDIVLLSMDSTQQEEWLEKNKGKVNTKLCVVGGSILPLIIRDNAIIPMWIRRLHLSTLYQWLFRIPYSHFFRQRIFNRKMDDYNTKKKLRGNRK